MGPFIGTGDKSVQERLHPYIYKGPAHKQHWNAITMQINEATIKENTLDENHAKRPCAISLTAGLSQSFSFFRI